MSRKDYQAIADALMRARKDVLPLEKSKTVLDIAAINLARAMAEDNPRFDRTRFLRASGVTDDED